MSLGGGDVRLATGTPTALKYSSWPAGEHRRASRLPFRHGSAQVARADPASDGTRPPNSAADLGFASDLPQLLRVQEHLSELFAAPGIELEPFIEKERDTLSQKGAV